MSFQWIVDTAESLSLNKLHIVGQSQTRSGVVRALDRGAQPVRITVKLPDGLAWDTYRDNILAAQALDRYTTATIAIPFARFPWYYKNVNPGTNESYTVLCVDFPQWNIFARNQVSWSGPFVFQEYIA